MFAIVVAGGRQEKVAPGAFVVVDRLEAEPGAEVTFDKVLLVETDAGGIVSGEALRGWSDGHRRGRGSDQGQEDPGVQDEAPEAVQAHQRSPQPGLTRVRVTSINV